MKGRQEGSRCPVPTPEIRLKLSGLELEAKAELDPAAAARAVRRNELSRNHAKILQATCKGKTPSAGASGCIAVCLPRIAIDDVVENVEEVGGEGEMGTLGNGRPLSKRGVQVPVTKSAKRI